ncbi:MAG: hypothetical protein KAT69_10625 [Candidatus Aminicenantes bacterium]|nr:hypothetical protein [Candidatus Aminicenantes bacterium]
MSEKGYIKIHRKIRNHKFWPGIEKREYSHFEAWIDLLLSAAGLPHKIVYRDQIINLKRGQMAVSIRKLAKRWGWSKDRVHRSLQLMIQMNEIRYQTLRQRISIISIVKYNTYNPLPVDYKDADKDADKDAKCDSDKDNINKDINKDKINKDVNKKSKTYMSSQFKNDIIFKWNKLAQEFNLAAIIDINSGSLREKNLRARSTEKNFDFDLLIDMIRNSPFLLGKTKDPFFVFFDWIIKPTNYQKIIEGNYLDRRSYQRFSGIIDGIKDLKKQHKETSKNET